MKGRPSATLGSTGSDGTIVPAGRRSASGRRTEPLIGPPVAAFDRLARLATAVLDAPMALVSLTESDRQVIVSNVGLPESSAPTHESTISRSICGHIVASGEALIVGDVRAHPHVIEHPAIAELGVIACAGIPLRAAEGETLGSFCVIDRRPRAWSEHEVALLTDLAAGAMTEIELHASQQTWRALAEHATDLVAILNRDGTYRFVSPSYQRILGFAPQELVGRSALDKVHPDDCTRMQAACARIVEQGESFVTITFRRRHADGSWRVLESRAANRLADPAVHGIVVNSRDVTERVRAEEVLRESEERFRHAFEDAPSAMCMVGLDGHYLRVNQAECRLLGYSAEELLHRDFLDHTHPDDVSESLEQLRSLLAGEVPAVLFEKRFLHRDGQTIHALVGSSVVRDQSGRPLYLLSHKHDITARRHAEEALRQINAQLAEASRLKSTFLATMSHEIRTPLNGVLGLAGLLLQTSLDAHQQEYVRGIRTSGETLLDLINDVLDLSKIEAGQLVLERVPFALSPIVEEVVEMFTAQVRSKGLEIAAFVERGIPTTLVGDPTRIRQVLVNLVGNAVKFTERGAVTVRIRLLEETDQVANVEVIVGDTGVGIARDMQAHLFDAFTQADASTTRRYGGTGLGLAICKQLVEQMGGKIDVDSAVGQGSTFRFTVPLARAREVPDVPDMNDRPRLRAHALVVGGAAPMNALLRDQLVAWGVQVEGADDGPAALEALRVAARRGQHHDMAIVDLQLSGMDALELARRMHDDADLVQVPVLLLSASPVDAADLECAGIAAHLVKPVRAARLYETLAALMGRPCQDEGAATSDLPPEPRSGRGRVLLAEDNPINRLVAMRLLEGLGYTVTVVEDGRQAVATIEQGDYDLVLMDCHMPELDGFAATAVIRGMEAGSARRTPIVALTADALADDAEKCREAGMDDYLAKPVTAERLADVASRWVPDARPATDPPMPV